MKTLRSGLVAMLYLTVQSTHALTINEYIEQAKQKNPLLKSYQESAEAARLKIISSEIDLAPVLTGSYTTSEDKSRPSQLGTKRESEIYTLGLAKKFQTGTTVKIDAQTANFDNKGAPPGFSQYSTGAVGVTLQQSLWKDFFGHGTRLKVSRQQKLAELEQLSAELQSRAALYDLESSFWDYAVAKEDLKLKQANLDRAKKIERWTSNRVSNGISDRADLMNAKALLALREAQLISAEEELKGQEVKFRDNLQLGESDATPVIDVNLTQARPYLIDLMKQKNIQKIEARIASLESEAKGLVAEETVDSLRPDLSVFGNYTTTSYEFNREDAVSNMTKDDYPKNTIGVNFTWVFDTSAKNSVRDASKKEALAAKLKAQKKSSEGQYAWTDLVRKYEVLKKSVSTLENVAQFQRERAKAEQNKLSQGRTVTANVVTAETDAAEAEINLLKTKSSLRKLEASSLFFVDVE
ncbi:MAG: TolC family protein [Pseudobdellovibrio sp.]